MKDWKIGEIYVYTQEEESTTKSGVGFLFNDTLTNEINKKENEDLKDRMVSILNLLHELLIDVQNREKEEVEYSTCSICGCEEEEEAMTTCYVCGEEFCPSCESWENPEMCDSCELDLQDGEE